METKNINITKKSAKVLTFEFCSPQTGTFSCTSFPVFSGATNDGTSFYDIDTPLKQLSPAGSYEMPNNPAVAYHAASGTGTITFNYGLTFSSSNEEYEAASDPRRYKYILHPSWFSPGTAFSASIMTNANVILGGSVNIFAAAATATSIISVCSIEVA